MEIQIKPNSQLVTWIIRGFLELPQKDNSYLDSPEFLFSGDRYCLRVYPKLNRSYGWRTEFHVRRLGVSDPKRKVSCKFGFRVRQSTGDDWYMYIPVGTKVIYNRSLIEEKRDVYVPDGSIIIACSMSLSKNGRARSSAQEEEEQLGFPGHNAFSSRWCPQKMELLAETPCTYVHLTVPKFFDLSRETCNTLTSPEFRFAGDTYCFRFRANGDTADTDLELVRLTFSIPERTVSYSVGHWLKDADIYPKNSRSLVGGTGLCITRSALEEKIYWYVIGGTLRLPLFLRLEEQSSTRTETSDAVQKLNGLSSIRKLQSDYRQLLQKGTESDACVVVQGTEFKVHKNVLRARSAVFEAMFGHDMAEKETGRVVIDDLDPECFKAFLEYLYTGEVQGILSDDMAENRSIVIDDLDLDSVKDFLEYLCTADLQNRLSNANAFGLYAAADKYDVSTLKSECVEHMRQTLSVDSFCDVVTLALLHDEKDLLQQSIRFFKDNMQGIVVTAKWQQFMCDNPKSANELIIKAIVPGKQ